MAPWCCVHANDLHLGSPRSYRFDPSRNENWAAARRQMAAMHPDLLLVGGDVTRDGETHEFEYRLVLDDFETLPWPWFAIPGNMDVGNKVTDRRGPHADRDDVRLNMTSDRLRLFASYFGPVHWTFQHKNVRFTGCYAAVAGSGLPEEEALWYLLERLPSLPRPRHHVAVMHYCLFIDELDEPTFDISDPEHYLDWYFGLDNPHRQRIFDLLKASGVELVLNGHTHCRRPEQVVDGIRFYKTPAVGGRPQWANRWPDGDTTIGFHRLDVTDDGIEVTFVPVEPLSTTEGYGPYGHPHQEVRDYSAAWVPGGPDG